ncbi:MAG TPA: hypothetical protein VJT49_22145 [Amycolatopsis sp.]|uniref:NACHT domain-containing protein n=1 Tax=Amycolatopsis sp. TaxID=37632 RepID=UPI002B46EC0F|nr:hypothetical protein [Amycolatopsis sp.]HKS47762.1 hypothetical protein [Amycolatopsis sp.]
MTKTFSYADAVRLLGGTGGKLLETLDNSTGGALLGATVGVPNILGCFGLSAKFVQLGQALVATLSERRNGLSRFDRTQRLHAAHSVIVITSYFEAIEAAELPLPFGDLALTKAEQVALVTDRAPPGARAAELIRELLGTPMPLPTPQSPHEVTVRALRSFYEELSARLIQFIRGLAAWDRLDDTQRYRFERAVASVPASATEGYERLLRSLAADFPEVGHWANLKEHQATRYEVRRLRIALAELEHLLREASIGTVPNERRAGLTRAYQAALDRPVIEPGDVPENIRIPTLREAYLDPFFRVADVPPGAAPSRESWWRDVPVRDDLNNFLAGYLTSPQATQAPLLVLGQPGSGKSVLTRVLAARLPPSDFLVVRVVLRETQADMDVQDQIEQAIRRTTGERLEWPALARSAGDALPVVLLDGFDEMLQATGVSQTDYLMRVRAFQHREADQGRPVSAMVTSRITVADRARIPDDTVAVRLEPFHTEQVTAWLEVWRDTNARYFRERGLTALRPDVALLYRELAEQPLLLLMLALYDADSNVLSNGRDGATGFSRADLYERLLVRFARREVAKVGEGYSADGMDRAVEEELRRLSVVAFAMFNRNSQWVTESDLERDLSALLGSRWKRSEGQDFYAPLGAAELVIGQFFFIQESRTVWGDRRLHTYEFLHATFGEFLVARLSWQVLAGMVARQSATELSMLGAGARDDALLFALLSFTPLSSHPSIIGFLAELSDLATESERLSLATLLVRLCPLAWDGRGDRGRLDYEPRPMPTPTRHSTYSANLLVLAVIAKGEVRASELFGAWDPITPWYRHVLLWRSQMSRMEFVGLVESVALRLVGDEHGQDLVLTLDDGSFVTPDVDLDWIFDVSRKDLSGEPAVLVQPDQHPNSLARRAHFSVAKVDALVQHLLEPLTSALPDSVNSLLRWPDVQLHSAANLLMRTVFLPLEGGRTEQAAEAYRRCADVAALDRLPWQEEKRNRYAKLLLERLAVDENASAAVIDDVSSTLLPLRGVRAEIARCVLTALGKDPHRDRNLVVKLDSLIDADFARAEPTTALESWTRLVELDLLDLAGGVLSSATVFFRLLDAGAVRPELVKRTRWALADRGFAGLWG